MILNKFRIGILFVLMNFGLSIVGCSQPSVRSANSTHFVEQDLSYQMDCGPRLPGSECHRQIQEWIISSLKTTGWQVEPHSFSYERSHGTNIIGKYGSGDAPILIGAHYDTRFTSDQETNPDLRQQPVPGANDGASGVALLLQLSREIPRLFSPQQQTVWLVFFDLEDNGNYPGWDWILGSTAFANSLEITPQSVVVVDMIGDKELNLYFERNSSEKLNQEIWSTAHRLGYDAYFVPELKYRMIDDHIPFIQRGIPTALLIDFDYPYWHTTQDTLDKVSPESILIVYDTLVNWMKERSNGS